MFFCIPFPELSVVTHSQWDDHNTQCTLRIFTTREAAEMLLNELPEDEADALRKHLLVLKQGSAQNPVEISGDAAFSLSNFVGNYGEFVEDNYVTRDPELLGFWEPLKTCTAGDGIIMWFEPPNDYHVLIVRSKAQAKQVIREFDWLEKEHQQLLLQKIENWNAPHLTNRDPQHIDDIPAELLCQASVTQKCVNALNSIMH